MVNNFPLFWRLVGGVLNLCYYACMNALRFSVALLKIHFMQGYSLKLPTSSPRAVRKGDLVHCAAEKKTAVLPYSTASSLLCSVPLLYPYAQAGSVGALSAA